VVVRNVGDYLILPFAPFTPSYFTTQANKAKATPRWPAPLLPPPLRRPPATPTPECPSTTRLKSESSARWVVSSRNAALIVMRGIRRCDRSLRPSERFQ